MTTKKTRTLIVGAGMAGLTAAAYLARENHPVLLVEKNDRTGGLVNTYHAEGFYFDSGPRAFVNSGMVQPILKDLGVSWEFVKNTISIGIEDQLFSVDSLDDLEEYKRVLVSLYPANRSDIERIFTFIKKLSDYTKVLYQFDNPNFVDLSSNRAYIFKELLPWSVKLLYVLRKMKKYNLPMEDFLARYTDNQSLIDMLTQFFFRKTPTYFALGYFYVYLDYFYPHQGTGALPGLLEENIRSWGGEIKLNTHILQVNPSEKTAAAADGQSYHYDHLIWAADLKTFYRNLNLDGLDPGLTKNITSESRKILAARGAESSFIMNIAADLPPSFFRSRGGEHLFFTPSREGLGETNRRERQTLLDNFDSLSRDELLSWVDQFCRLNTYEVSLPALRDPALAPEGQTGIMISCLFDYDLIKKIDKAGWYDQFKSRMENRIIDLFSKSIYKGLADHILFKFSSTPLTINRVAGSSQGAITGWSFETEIPVENQLKDIPKSALTPIPEVYQAGQWTYSPSGVPIAMLTGWHAAQNILKKSGKTS